MKRQHPDNPDLFWCPKCQTYKARGDFYVDKRYDRYGQERIRPTGWCKECRNAVKRPPDKYREYKRIWARENPSDWRKKNKGRAAEINKKCWARSRDSLGDRYIHNQIYVTHGVKIADQTPEMIELKRQQIMMKRTLKQLKEWRKEHESNHADVQREQRTDEEVNGRQRPAQP